MLPIADAHASRRREFNLTVLLPVSLLLSSLGCGAAGDPEHTDIVQLEARNCPQPQFAAAGGLCPEPPEPPCTRLSGTLIATPSTIHAGQSATLRWQVLGSCAGSVTLDGAPVARTGTLAVAPGSTKQYTLKGGSRAIAHTNVTVLPGVCSAQLCSSPASCGVPCAQGTAITTCDAWSFQTADDADLDGVPDTLENELGRRYFPDLRLRASSYNGSPHGDFGQLYSGQRGMGDWQFVVRPVTAFADRTTSVWNRDIDDYQYVGPVHQCADDFQCLELVYVVPYNWDLGDLVGGHRGDAEMYSVLVARRDPRIRQDGLEAEPRWDAPWETAKNDPAAWTGYSEFASAHMCTDWDSSSHRFRLFTPAEHGVSTLWVAEGKHAGYFSQGACDHGGNYFDSCDSNHFTLNLAQHYGGAGPLRNAGDESCHAHPSLDHLTAYPGELRTHAPYATYDVWSDTPFGDDDVGRPLALLRAGTMLWWKESNPRKCWPGATSHPPAPPGGVPVGPCGHNGECCELGEDENECLVCKPIGGQCP
ncbi:MAG: hypothetical protein K0R38_1661 [Polyangiaceae bacterium]|jgi:hypothetical protein|nr:hypothetical protein [Polyangiaceae bacterium]